MAPLALWLLQGLFLVLLYLFVARAVRTVLRDLEVAPTAAPAAAQSSRAPAGSGSASRLKQRLSGQPQSRVPTELVVHMPEGRSRVISLDGSTVTFGRSETSTVMLADTYVSEHHASVSRQGERWVITDHGSTNGTYVNKRKIQGSTAIGVGDQLGIGKSVVEVRA